MTLVLMLIFVVSALSVIASAAESDGMSFGNENYFDQEKLVTVNGNGVTFEAEICIDHSFTYKSAAYVVFGNFASKANSFDLLIRSGKYVELYVRNANNGTVSPRFDGADISEFCGTAANPAYCKISLSVEFNDAGSSTVTLYLSGTDANGNAKTYTASKAANIPSSIFKSFAAPNIRIGGDIRSTTANSVYFVGKTKNVAMYGDVRTEAEVSADMAKSFSEAMKTNASDANLLFAYDLTDTSVTGLLTDLSANKNNAINPFTYVPPQEDNGFVFSNSDNYDMETVITPNGAMTFEAELTLPVDGNNDRLGWVVGNYIDFKLKEFGIEFQADRKIRAFICNGNKSNTSAAFALPSVPESEANRYRKIAFTFDNATGTVSFYIDGELQGATTSTLFKGDSTHYNQDTPLRLGGDYRGGNSWYLRALKVKNIAMYKGISSTAGSVLGLDAMFFYDLTDTSVTGKFSDLSGNSNDAIDKNKYDMSKKYDYSFAVVGDTQYMTKWDAMDTATKQYLEMVYDWIIANKDKKNIKYVMGLGDITDTLNGTNTANEWKVAAAQIARLDGVLPYSQVRGNHDNSTYFNQYFDNDAYKSQLSGWYEGTGVLNTYSKFEVYGQKYLLLALDDKADDNVVAWANGIVSANPEYRVIITTHTYMGHTGELIDSTDEYWQYCTGKTNIAVEGDIRNDGKELWDKLVSKHSNIVLVLCGHDYKNTNIVRNVRIGDNGNAVNEFLICPQSLDGQDRADNKKGMVAMLYFSNDSVDVRIEYVSTVATKTAIDGKDVYYNEDTNNKTYSLMKLPVISEYGYIFPEYSDASKYPFAVFSESGKFLGAFDSFLDAENPYNNGGAIYAAKTYLGSKTWSNGSYSDNKSVVVWLRADYNYKSNESYDNMTQVRGKITLDLDGHTITMPSGRTMFPSTIKPNGSANIGYEAHFEVINGEIILNDTPLISFRGTGGSSNVDVSERLYTHSFTNVKFTATSTSSNALVSYSTNSDDAIYPKLVLNGCTFDMTNAPSGAIIADLVDTAGFVNLKAEINGCSFVGNDFAVSNSGNITYSGYNGEYNRITLPSTASAPVAPHGGLEYIVESTDGTTTTYILVPTASIGIDFKPMASVTLDSNLIFNIYIPAHAGLGTVTLDGASVDLGEANEGYYVISTPLTAAEAARELKLVVNLTVNGTDLKGSFTFSTVKYAEKLLADGSISTTEKALAKDMLNYIDSAYKHFNGDAVLDAPYASGFNIASAEAKKTIPGLSGATFVLDAKPAVRFYFADGYSYESFTFKVGNRILTEKDIVHKDAAYVEFSLYAYEMTEDFTYTVGGEPGAYNLIAYYAYASGTGNNDYNGEDKAELSDLVAKFYNYCASANAYRASIIGK